MAEIKCQKCGETKAGYELPPFPGAIGARVLEGTCPDCWQLWLKQQTMLINHYGLNVMDPQARFAGQTARNVVGGMVRKVKVPA